MNKFDISIIIILFLIVVTLTFLKLKNTYCSNNIDNQIKNILKNDSCNQPAELNQLENNKTEKTIEIDKTNKTIEMKENFIVADAQDFHNYDKLRDIVKKEDNDFDKDRIINPPNDKKVDYDKEKDNSEYSIMVVHGEPKRVNDTKKEKSFITASDFGWDAPFPSVSCSNGSIDERYKSGPKHLLPYQVSCGYANKITAENYYKTHFMAQAIPLEDYAVRGANYMDYTDFTHPSKISIRILSQNTKGLPPEDTKYRNIPTGTGYAFHNTPSMP